MRDVRSRPELRDLGERPAPYVPWDEDELHVKATELLQNALGNPSADFRDGQWEAIRQLVSHRAHLLLVQRTGWGKSIVYFIATSLLREHGAGPTLLISPLLSLMRNQILAAERLGIRAATMNSSNTEQWTRIEGHLFNDEIDLLLISPERLANEHFQRMVLPQLSVRAGLFAVDEAHCISDWGHDFRPDYRRIVRVLQLLPATIPLIATTATANDRVVEDIAVQLGKRLQVIRGPLGRQSLQLQAMTLPSQAERLAWLAEHVPNLPGSGIIYILTVADTHLIAEWLRMNGVSAEPYSGRLDSGKRERLESQLLANEVKVLVATVALGMGFDKPDLGFVIHFQRPGSVVAYYQQIGRAGRSLKDAYVILLQGAEDDDIIDYFIRTAFPPEAHAEAVLDELSRAPDGLNVRQIERWVNAPHNRIEQALKLLSLESPAPVQKIGGQVVCVSRRI